MKLALVQNKPRKGDLERNLAALGDAFAQLAADPPDLIVAPEAALTGYFLEGAVYEHAFETETLATRLGDLWRANAGERRVDLAIGFYENAEGTYYNSALYLEIDCDGQRVVHVHRKMFLPTYGVFDEERFLSRGRRLRVFPTRFGTLAMLVCEDAWHALVPTVAALKGARMLLIPSASPGRGLDGTNGELTSIERWRELLRGYALEHGLFVVYASLAGFEGGKGMTGSSCAIDPSGNVLVEAPALGAHLVRVELDLAEVDIARARLPLLGDLRAVLPDLLLDDELPLPTARSYEGERP